MRKGWKIIGFLSLIFLVSKFKAQTIDDPNSAYNGIWSNGNTNLLTASANPNLVAAQTKVRWDSLQPTDSATFNWTYFNKEFTLISSANLLIGTYVYVGPMSPMWLYSPPFNVPQVSTSGSGQTGSVPFYPYYLDHNYLRLWKKMMDSVSAHIDIMPTYIRNKIVFYNSCEGKTGDANPYDGAVVSASVNSIPVPNANTTYSISDQTWSAHKRVIWQQLNTMYSTKIPIIHLLVNPSNDGSENGWLDAYLPYVWRKSGDCGDGYQLNNEASNQATFYQSINSVTTTCKTNAKMRGEADAFGSGHYQQNLRMNFYFHALCNLHFGLDTWQIANYQLYNLLFTDGFSFFSKYAGKKDPKCSPGAFCALRDGLDAADYSRFPALPTFSTANQNAITDTVRCCNIAQAFAIYGAEQGDPKHAQTSSIYNKQANKMNDVGYDILSGNYERYLTQWTPSITSQGYWRQGDETQPYGRFARGFNHNAGMDTMFFDIHDDLFTTFPNNAIETVTVNVTYLDKGNSQWKLMYDGKNAVTGLSQRMTAYTMTNTNTTNNFSVTNIYRNQNYLWKTKSFTITNGMFGNNCRHNTDLMLVNKDNVDEIFHMIEVIKAPNITMGFNKEVLNKNLSNYLMYPNPTNGNLNVSSDRIISGEYYEIMITNILGEVVFANNFIAENNTININCNSLVKGIYILGLKSEDGLILKKMIKE